MAQVEVHCRQCGGERWHDILFAHADHWEDPDNNIVEGLDTWETLRCGGCHAVTFRHSHWFSEDTDPDGTPIEHHQLFPPSPSRKEPEWLRELWLLLPTDDLGVRDLIADIYATAGMRAFGLAAMGARSVVDYLVTSVVGDDGSFHQKLTRLSETGKIGTTRVEVLNAAFDAGSAAAHRGHSPTQADLFTMLQIMEGLIFDLLVKPYRDRKEAEAAEKMRARTPARKPA